MAVFQQRMSSECCDETHLEGGFLIRYFNRKRIMRVEDRGYRSFDSYNTLKIEEMAKRIETDF